MSELRKGALRTQNVFVFVVVNVGGTLGLLTGLSLIGMVDMFYWMFKYFFEMVSSLMTRKDQKIRAAN